MALALGNVTVTAGRARLIEDVSFALHPGSLTVVLGANGAGKSTALAVAAADLRPSGGEAMLDGTPLGSLTPRALAMRRAVVLQHTPMNFALCVHEVVALSRTPFGKGTAARDGVEERALRALELLPLAGRDYPTLSGGERQRVQIARALAQLWHAQEAGRPGYLLMDEPTAHLDLKHQVIALEAARDFANAGGAALCILHDIGLAREFSDAVLLMKQGRLVASGRAADLLTAPVIADIYGISEPRARQFAAS